jgi:hypothetical protein
MPSTRNEKKECLKKAFSPFSREIHEQERSSTFISSPLTSSLRGCKLYINSFGKPYLMLDISINSNKIIYRNKKLFPER